MLITELKDRETIASLAAEKKVFIITCHGCREVYFPEKEMEGLLEELNAECRQEIFFSEAVTPENDAGRGDRRTENLDRRKVCSLTGSVTTDYICNPGLVRERLENRKAAIEEAEVLLVFSCGIGVQTIAELYEDKRVYAGCDTYALPGIQGVIPTEHDCRECGTCFLNLTGGICPLTACAKGLLNGQCGGSKNGKCEVDGEMDCGWELIYRRLAQTGRMDAIRGPVQLRSFAADEYAKK